MKFEVTENGVHGQGGCIEPGTVIEIRGDAVPAWLVGKGRVLDRGQSRQTVINPKGDDKAVLLAEAEEMGIEVDGRWSADRLREAIEAAKKSE